MSDLNANALRLIQLFDRMRSQPPGPAFAELSALNLSHSHVRAMGLLAPDRTMPMKELADKLCLTPPSVTALTRRLVHVGLVRRLDHPEDSRVVLLTLSDEGRALYQRLYDDHVRRMEQLLAGLSAEDQQLFLDLLDRATG